MDNIEVLKTYSTMASKLSPDSISSVIFFFASSISFKFPNFLTCLLLSSFSSFTSYIPLLLSMASFSAAFNEAHKSVLYIFS